MECPKCKNVQLEKTDLSKPIWCPACGGMWVSSKEIEEISTSFVEDLNLNQFDSSDYDGKTGLCPLGHGIMLRAKIEGDRCFYLERCPHCGGIWFDHGEWQQVTKHHLMENLTDVWTSAWQRKHQKEKDRSSFIEMNKKLIGEDIVQKTLELAELIKDHPEKARALALLKQEVMS